MIEPPRPTRAKKRPDSRCKEGNPAERQRQEPEPARWERLREQHHGDRCDGVGLEQVSRHPGAVAHVVADVVRDHGRVARVVLGDPGLDLSDQVGAHVGGLRVDAAAEPREDRNQ
jgi:hypothetical protein